VGGRLLTCRNSRWLQLLQEHIYLLRSRRLRLCLRVSSGFRCDVEVDAGGAKRGMEATYSFEFSNCARTDIMFDVWSFLEVCVVALREGEPLIVNMKSRKEEGLELMFVDCLLQILEEAAIIIKRASPLDPGTSRGGLTLSDSGSTAPSPPSCFVLSASSQKVTRIGEAIMKNDSMILTRQQDKEIISIDPSVN
jgi:hypothetical protein